MKVKMPGASGRKLMTIVIALLLAGLATQANTITNTYQSSTMTPAGHQGGGGYNGNYNTQITYGAAPNNWVWKFDTRLGNLNSITFSLTTDYLLGTSYSYSGFGPPSPGSFSDSFSVSPRMYDSANRTFLSYSASSSGSGIVPVNGFGGSDLSIHYSQSATFTDAAILAEFKNNRPDMVYLNFWDNQMYNSTTTRAVGGPSGSYPVETYLYTVAFDYTPVPEPGTMALGLAGALVLAGMRVRGRRKQPTS
jgi:hypothetical protein